MQKADKGHKVGRIITKTAQAAQAMGKYTLPIIGALAFLGTLTGCVSADEANGEPLYRRLFYISSNMSQSQTRWVIIGEAILIVLFILLIVMLIALFQQYRRAERRAEEASAKERILMKENEVLDRLNSTKTEFMQNMSHDIKTPLTVISTSIINAIDMLDFEIDREEMREILNLAQAEIMRMGRMVDRTLENADLNDDRQSNEAIDLLLLMRKVVNTYHNLLERHNNKLRLTLPSSLPYARGNADLLLNIFSNLLSNANRYTRGGDITIKATVIGTNQSAQSGHRDASKAQQFISIEISDTGTGIKPGMLPNVFDRGVSETGTGLGLSICKTAIETQGGTIDIKSKYGKGTSVTFTIPVFDYDYETKES